MVDQATVPLNDNLTTVASDPEVWKNNIFGLEMPADVISIAYALTVAAGGAIGYFTKGNTIVG